MILQLLLLCSIAQSGSEQCGKEMNVAALSGQRSGLQSMAHRFLDTVGTSVPYNDVRDLLDDLKGGNSKSGQRPKREAHGPPGPDGRHEDSDSSPRSKITVGRVWGLAKKQAGFTACLVVGILLIVLLPIAGIVILVVRCACNSCGAKREQNDPRMSEFIIRAVGLAICAAFWIASIACYVQNGTKVWPSLNAVHSGLLVQINNTQAFAENLEKNSGCMGDNVINDVRVNITRIINTIPAILNKTVDEEFPSKDFDELFGELGNLQTELETVKEKVTEMKDNEDTAYGGVDRALSTDLMNALPVLKKTKDDIQKKHEDLRDRFSEITDGIDGFIKELLKFMSKKTEFDSMKGKIDERAQSVVKDVQEEVEKDHLKDISQKLKEATNTIDSTTDKVVQQLEKLKRKLTTDYSPKQIEEYKWAMDLLYVLVLPAAVVLAMIAISVTCGIIGFSADAKPNERSGSSNASGRCLVITAYVTFILGTLIVVVTFLLFFLGYSLEALACRPLFYQRNEGYMDFLTKVIGGDMDNDQANFSMAYFLNQCEKDSGIASALRAKIPEISVRDKFSVRDKLHNAIKEAVKEPIQDLNEAKSLKIPPYMSEERLSKVQDYMEQAVEELEKVLGLVEENKVKISQISATMYQETRDGLNDTKTKYSELALKMGNLMPTVTSANMTAGDIKTSVSTVQSKLIAMRNSSSAQFNQFANTLENDLVTKFKTIVADIIDVVMGMGRCKPLFTVYSNVGQLLCGKVVDPLNGMWFSMGMGLFAIVPTIVFSFLLSRYCMRMSYMDSYDIEMDDMYWKP